jgi:hypothetical protein
VNGDAVDIRVPVPHLDRATAVHAWLAALASSGWLVATSGAGAWAVGGESSARSRDGRATMRLFGELRRLDGDACWRIELQERGGEQHRLGRLIRRGCSRVNGKEDDRGGRRR